MERRIVMIGCVIIEIKNQLKARADDRSNKCTYGGS